MLKILVWDISEIWIYLKSEDISYFKTISRGINPANKC